MTIGEYTREIVHIGVAGHGRVRQPTALVSGDRGPALPPNPREQRSVDVEGDHGEAVLAGKMKQRHVEVGVITPDFFLIRLLKKLLDIVRAGDPSVQSRLDPPREHLEADNHIRIMGVQGGEHL